MDSLDVHLDQHAHHNALHSASFSRSDDADKEHNQDNKAPYGQNGRKHAKMKVSHAAQGSYCSSDMPDDLISCKLRMASDWLMLQLAVMLMTSAGNVTMCRLIAMLGKLHEEHTH